MENQIINLAGEQFEVIDSKEKMTVPDCFVLKNKIGCGHGEAKFYIGNDNEETRGFFDNFNRRCIFLRSDFLKYLEDAETEYKNPQQPYRKKDEMPNDWNSYLKEIKELPNEVLEFHIKYQEQIAGPRIYINSEDAIYKKILRLISLPSVTYLSALKLKSEKGEILYYFRLFLDYFGDEDHPSLIKKEELEIQKDRKINLEDKEEIVKARRGQGIYRSRLLVDCPFCPITSITDDRILIASHIKPWIKSNNEEKIDPKNGFMFTPTYDFLFDRGFISFKDNKTIMVSPWLSKMTVSKLGIIPGKKYHNLPIEGRELYLEYHRENIYKE